jgi:ribosomal protein S18 acetylase RimI-like enzyme
VRAHGVIRDVEPSDESALAALEREAPESARLMVQIEPRVGYFDLFGRYQGVRGFVATDGEAARILGVLFSSVAPTQLNGAVVPGAYLFSLRVHPTMRRRGIASALIVHACERARTEAGAEVAWAAVREGNDASLRTFAEVGFVRLRDLGVRIIPPIFGPPRVDPRLLIRPATGEDLPLLAGVLNRAHAAHNFWRPCTTEGLATALMASRHSLDDVVLARGADGDILAGGAVFDLRRVVRLRLLGHQGLPDRLNRAFALLLARVPLRPLVLRYRALWPERTNAALALLRSIQRASGSSLSALAIPLDRQDPAWPVIVRPWGMTTQLHVVARSTEPVDESRPMHLD